MARYMRTDLGPHHSHLSPPAVVGAGIYYRGIQKYYTPEPRQNLVRRQAKSRISPPAVVNAAPVFYGPHVSLTVPRHPSRATHPLFIYPIVVLQTQAWGYIGIQLAPQRRGLAKSRLFGFIPPAAAQVYYGPSTHIIRGRRPLAKSALRPPSVLATSGPSQYVLTYSRRGRPRSFLRPPTDTIGLEDQGKVSTHLTRQHRTVARYRLFPPTVVTPAAVYYGPVVHLARNKPQPTTIFLRPFSERAFEVSLGPEIHLSPSRRPVAKSRLQPPAVVAPVVSYGPAIELAPSFRGQPKSFLKPPTVVNQPPAYAQVLPPTFAPQRRGRPTSFLSPPTVVFPFFARRLDVTLAPQTRGRPLSFLSPPAILRERGQVQVTLAPQRRGKAKPFLRPPVVVRLAVEIYGPEVTLAPSRFPKPKSFLSPPVVVGRQPFRGILTHLAYSRRGRGFTLKQPELQKVVFRGLQVHLAYSRRGKPRFFLRPAAVVRQPVFGVIQVHLTRIKHPPVQHVLRPPVVVNAAEFFYGPQVTLVRIRPRRVIHLQPRTFVSFRRPQGDVCGFDIARSFVCELQLPGSQVSGSDAPVHGVSGTSRADTKITGSDSAGGSVSGSDRKAT